MTRLSALVAVVLMSLAACGADGEEVGARPRGTTAPPAGDGLSLAVRHPEPLHSGGPVTWTLEVRNTGTEPVTLVFTSGQRGDVVLRQGGSERYRWSRGRAFTLALAQMPLAAGEARSFDLREERLGVDAGEYELVASLASQPAPPPVTRRVTVVSR